VNEGDTINVVVKKPTAGTPPIAAIAGEGEGDGDGEGERSEAIAGIAGNGDAPASGSNARQPTDPDSGRALLGVAGAGAVMGSVVLGGLITGPIIVGGAALYASQRGGRLGTIVKQGGAKIADAAGSAYRVAKRAGNVTMTKAKELNENYDITGKAEKASIVVVDTAVKVGSTMRRWSVGVFNMAKGAVGRPSDRDATNAAAATPASSAVPVAQGRVVNVQNASTSSTSNTVFTAANAAAVESTHTEANATPQPVVAEVSSNSTATTATTAATATTDTTADTEEAEKLEGANANVAEEQEVVHVASTEQWTRRTNEEGRKYWQNSVTREKVYKDPTTPAAKP